MSTDKPWLVDIGHTNQPLTLYATGTLLALHSYNTPLKVSKCDTRLVWAQQEAKRAMSRVLFPV